MSARHLLSEKDVEKRTAICSIDGPVDIRNVGGDNWQCAVKNRATQQRWQKENPVAARRSRRGGSGHKLIDRDVSTMTATCVKCDTLVGMVPYGGGYGCENMAATRRSVQQKAPAGGRCRECKALDPSRIPPRLTANGCLRCQGVEPPELTFPGEQEKIAASFPEGGYTKYSLEAMPDPSEVSRQESVVQGWRVIGEGDADRWWAENGHLVEGC